MDSFSYRSAAEQLASHLRGLIERGQLTGDMPGVDRLATTHGVSHRTVIGAMEELTHEGLLLKQGPGRANRINAQHRNVKSGLRIQHILYDREEGENDAVSPYLLAARRQVLDAGHAISFSSKTLQQLGMDVKRVARYAKSVDCDAWVVSSGSREVLNWFSNQPLPAFAFFGRRRGLPIAGVGPNKEGAYQATARRLLELGHRRIVMLARPVRRLPQPGLPEQAFLDELNQAGIMTGSYNLPDWDGSNDNLHKVIESTFRLTPPTAMIIDEPQVFFAVQHHLAHRGILAPEHVSLVCADQDAMYEYMRPSVAHIKYETDSWARHVVSWANHVAKGKDDRRQTLTKAVLVEGDTLGPVPKG